jgi:hypothetical protein
MFKDDCLKQIVAQTNRPFRTKNRIAQILVSLWEENLENEKRRLLTRAAGVVHTIEWISF